MNLIDSLKEAIEQIWCMIMTIVKHEYTHDVHI